MSRPVIAQPYEPGEYEQVPQRGYSFSRGDRRFFDRELAIEHGNMEALRTGVRQSVKISSPATLGGDPLWLVQAVGS